VYSCECWLLLVAYVFYLVVWSLASFIVHFIFKMRYSHVKVREYVFTGVGLCVCLSVSVSVCVLVCEHDN